ncbi:MAG: DUF1194 domain-containing protein [Planctomycetota bacterium]
MRTKNALRLGAVVLGASAAVIIACIIFKPGLAPAQSNTVVPMELALLVDTSESVDDSEYVLQQRGYVEAFRSVAVTDRIKNMGGIAVVYVEWDNVDNQRVRVPWTHLRNRGQCLAFANAIERLERLSSGTTMMAAALAFAQGEFDTNEFTGLRRVIDVSGDGRCNNWRWYELGIQDNDTNDPAHYGTPWNEVVSGLRDAVHSVNGIYVGGSGVDLDFYNDVLPMGRDGFSMHATGFGEFADTVEQKILREISVPIPGTYD